MLKCSCNKGEIDLNVDGTISEILADLCAIVGEIRNSISDEECKEFFEDTLRSGLFVELALASHEEVEKKCAERDKRVAELKSIVVDLEELAKAIKNL